MQVLLLTAFVSNILYILHPIDVQEAFITLDLKEKWPTVGWSRLQENTINNISVYQYDTTNMLDSMFFYKIRFVYLNRSFTDLGWNLHIQNTSIQINSYEDVTVGGKGEDKNQIPIYELICDIVLILGIVVIVVVYKYLRDKRRQSLRQPQSP